MKSLAPLFLLAILLPPSLHAQKGYPPSFPEAKEHVYKTMGDVSLSLYGFYPEGWAATDKRPAVVFFFGGGWKGGSPKQFEHQSKRLAAQGLVAFTADYRVASRHQTLAKDCVADARDAVRWIRSHATELGIDPDRLAAGGGSAGGHLAACLGSIPSPENETVSSRPNALLLFNPATVLATFGDIDLSEREEELRQRMGTETKNLSPIHHVDAKTPPTVLFHGTNDPVVPFLSAEAYVQQINKRSTKAILHAYEGAGHGFFNYGRDENRPFESTIEQTIAFLKELGWIE